MLIHKQLQKYLELYYFTKNYIKQKNSEKKLNFFQSFFQLIDFTPKNRLKTGVSSYTRPLFFFKICLIYHFILPQVSDDKHFHSR
jgi:hypothetical protein